MIQATVKQIGVLDEPPEDKVIQIWLDTGDDPASTRTLFVETRQKRPTINTISADSVALLIGDEAVAEIRLHGMSPGFEVLGTIVDRYGFHIVIAHRDRQTRPLLKEE